MVFIRLIHVRFSRSKGGCSPIMRRFICMLLLFLMPLTALGASMHTEVENSSIDLDVQLGYSGSWTFGREMPVTVRVVNRGGDFDGTLAMNTYVSPYDYNRYEVSLSLPSGAEKEVEMAVCSQSKQEVYTLELLSGDEVLRAVNVRPRRLLHPSAMLIGVLSEHPEMWSFMDITSENDELYRGEYWQTAALDRESFPSTQELLSAFDMLVVDGVDLQEFSQDIQENIRAWIRQGGIVLLSGGPSLSLSGPAFESLTGLHVQASEQSMDPTPAVLAALSSSSAPLGTEIPVALIQGGEPLIASNGTGLVFRSPVDSGVIYTLAFSPAVRDMSAWAPAHTLFQRLFLQNDAALYQDLFNRNSGSDNYMFGHAEMIPLEGQSGMLQGMLVIPVVLVLAIAIGIWCRKKDRRTLMWAVYPILSAAACAAICVIAHFSVLNKPLELSMMLLDMDGQQAVLRQSTIVSSSDKGEHFVSSASGLSCSGYDGYSGYYEEDDHPDEPTRMQYRFVSGDRKGIGFTTHTAWDPAHFYTEQPFDSGIISGSIWMEPDGLHGEIVNGLQLSLPAGAVFTPWGFADIPEIMQGEKADFQLLRGKVKDKKNPVYPAGILYEDSFGEGITYALVDEYLNRTSEKASGAARRETPEQEFTGSVLRTLCPDTDQYARNSGMEGSIVYLTFQNSIPEYPIAMDGKEISRRAHRTAVRMNLEWLEIGRTGVFYHMPGQDPAVRWEIGTDLMPADQAMNLSGYSRYYHSLSENPTFCYDLSGIQGIHLTSLSVHTALYGSTVQSWILNPETETWERIELDEKISSPETYVSPAGQLFVQFRIDGSNGQYMEIPTPTITLEGSSNDA